MGNKTSTNTNNKVEYNEKTTGDEAIAGLDLTNKVAIVTGCNTGIGKETVRVLAKQKAIVIMACRNLTKAKIAKADITKSIQTEQKDIDLNDLNSRLIIMNLDLADLQNIKDFVDEFNKKNLTLNYLINNAGVFGYKSYTLSTNGYELQFAINYLGPFYLTNLLLNNLLDRTNKLEPSRVIHIASAMHKDAPNPFGKWIDKHIKLNDGPLKNDYSRAGNYCISKGCTVLFARELHRRYGINTLNNDNKDRKGLISVSVHPGFVASEIGRNLGNFDLGNFVMKNILSHFIKNCVQGSATTLRCISLPYNDLKGGNYYVDCKDGNHIVVNHLQPKQYDINKINDSQECISWKWAEILIKKAGFQLNDIDVDNQNDNDIDIDVKQDDK